MPGRGGDVLILCFGIPEFWSKLLTITDFYGRWLTPQAERLRVLDIGSIGGGRFHAENRDASIGVHHEHFLHHRRHRRRSLCRKPYRAARLNKSAHALRLLGETEFLQPKMSH